MATSSGGSSVPRLRLPRGGGAIKGIGETFQPSAFTGTASFSLPIATPEARGLGPELSLDYSSGGSQGPFGLGFSVSVPHIARRIEKRLPDYSDADEFVLSSAEYLVPRLVQQEDGRWTREQRESADGLHVIRRFRTRTEGGFLRVEQWTRREDGDVHWRVTTPESVTSIYGASADARIVDPDDPRRVFQWLIEHTEDRRGNQLRYSYSREDTRGVADVVCEAGRTHTTQRYLHRVDFGSVPGPGGQTRWAFSVVFDHGDYDLDNLDALTSEPSRDWPARADAFSDYRAGFEVRTHRLCRNILVFHHFESELGARDTLVRRLALEYTETPTLSLLRAVRPIAYAKGARGWEAQPAPALRFDYTAFEPEGRAFETIQVEGERALPLRFEPEGYQMLDVLGEGIAGLLHDQSSTNLYHRPRGRGIYEPGASLTTYPIEQHQRFPTYAVTDGLTTWVNVRTGGRSGFYELESDDRWAGFRAFHGSPTDYINPDLDSADVTGDGFADLLLFEADRVRVYPSTWREGHGPPFTALRGPALPVQADPGEEQKLVLVDMVGDGLSDRVRVRNGEVVYWPNLGYGNFGAPVVMAGAPHVDGRMAAGRVYLTDIDGSGTADLVYITGAHAAIYFNQSGNSFSEPVIVPLPEPYSGLSQVQFADVQGNGTSALVFSTGTDAVRHAFYDFSGGVKPYLLRQIDNGRGALTRIQYAPSTKFYLADREAGAPWLSRLPFPVHVVERTESVDLLAHTRQVTRYAYHHGAYDYREREFAGFGQVERWDTEGFEQFTSGDLANAPPFELLDSSLQAPPSHTRTWYHTGLLERDGVLSRQYAEEYYDGDPGALQLADSSFETPIDPDGVELAYRALRGRALREEVYGITGDPQRDPHPYRVTETAYRLRFEQPTRDGHNSVYLPLMRERITCHYERDPGDPRQMHELFLEHDAFGELTRQATLAYPRRSRDAAEHPDQLRLQGSYTSRSFIHLPDVHRLGIPAEVRQFELGGLSPDQGAYYSWRGLAEQYPTPEQDAVDFDQSLAGRSARLLTWRRTFYWDEPQTQALSFGQASARALPHHTETAIYPLEGLDALFAATGAQGLGRTLRQTLLGLDADGGAYVERAAPSGRVYYVDPGITAEYGGATEFYQAVRFTDQFGTQTTLDYDPHGLVVVRRAERLSAQQSLVQRIVPDYRTLQPAQAIDVNDNITEYRYDPAGNVRLISRRGTEGTTQRGDRPLDEHRLPATLSVAAILADPAAYLQNATSFYVTDTRAWEDRGQPLQSVHIRRHRYTSDLAQGATSELQIQLDHTDGLGRALQSKLHVEPGIARRVAADGSVTEEPTDDRWLTSGRTVYNNKGSVVKQYEPFYAVGADFQPERVLTEHGVTAVRHHDPLGRVFRADLPKGFLNRTEFGAWSVRELDANDTIEQSPYFLENNGRLPADEQDALDKARAHADTPLSQALDPWGRSILDQQRPDRARVLTTYKQLDIVGNVRGVQDPRLFGSARFNFQVDHDMLGRPLRQIGVDRGARWTLINAGGDEIHRWDGRGFHHATHYDALSRPIALWVTGNGLSHQLQAIEYGEAATNSIRDNLRGRITRHRDSGGVLEVQRYDLDGGTALGARRLRENYRDTPDWSGAEAVANETWTTQTVFDTFRRPVEVTYPDGRQVRHGYYRSGRLRSVDVDEAGQPTQSIVRGVDYNARGQRTAIRHGNGVESTLEYDPRTFHVTRIDSQRTSDGQTLQDVNYFYDPAGNITRTNDRSNRVVFTNNQAVSPVVDYTYDAVYRLTTASGRAHRGLYNPTDAVAPDYQQFLPQPPSVNDPNALENYTRTFEHDDAGNLLRVVHVATSHQFTRTIAVSDTSNRGQVAPGGAAINVEQDYDENGNVIRQDHLRAMAWNSVNQLASVDIVQRGGGTNDAEYYSYDATGARVHKVFERVVGGNTVIEETIYLGGFEIRRTRRGNNIRESYTTLQIAEGDTRVASVHLWSRRPQGQNFDRQTRYQLGNHQGSTSFELDEQGQIITYEEYYPYGGTSLISGRSQQEVTRKLHRYAGRERDANTHFYYFGARYYAPWMGRWLSPDPAGAQDGANLYTYVRGNPVRHVDRDGQVAVDLNNAGTVRRRVEFYTALSNGTRAPAPPTRTPQRVAIERELAAIPRNIVAERRRIFESGPQPPARTPQREGIENELAEVRRNVDVAERRRAIEARLRPVPEVPDRVAPSPARPRSRSVRSSSSDSDVSQIDQPANEGARPRSNAVDAPPGADRGALGVGQLPFGERQIDVELATARQLTPDRDVSARLTDDPVDHRQPHPRALPQLLGREEGIEDPLDGVRAHPAPCIADGQPRVPPERRIWMHGDVRAVERCLRRRDRELPSVGHRVPGVHDEVDDDLLELPAVHVDAGCHGVSLDAELDVLDEEPAQHRLRLCEDAVQIQGFGTRHLLSREGQELPGQRRRTFRARMHLLERLEQRGIGNARLGGAAGGELAVPDDDGQEIVEVVRHAAREVTDRLHLLRLPKLHLAFELFGDVPLHGHIADGLATSVLDRRERQVFRIDRAVLALVAEASTPREALGDRSPQVDIAIPVELPVSDRGGVLPDDFLGLVPRDFRERRIDVGDDPRGVRDHDRIHRLVDRLLELPEPRLRERPDLDLPLELPVRLLQLAGRLLDEVEHRVEGLGDVAELVVREAARADREVVPLGNRLCRLLKLHDRA